MDYVLDDPFSAEQIEVAINKLKKGKSGGVDGLLPEHLKHGGPALIPHSVTETNLQTFFHIEHAPCKQYTKASGKTIATVIDTGITTMSVIMKTFEYAVLE